MPPNWQNPTDAKLSDIQDSLRRIELAQYRNTRHILKVMTKQHAEIMALLQARPKGVLTFGKPQDKPTPPKAELHKADQPSTSPPKAGKEKSHGKLHD